MKGKESVSYTHLDVYKRQGHTSISLNPECMPEIDWDFITEENILEHEEEGFLSHFHIKNSYEFEEWIESMQDQYDPVSYTHLDVYKRQMMW